MKRSSIVWQIALLAVIGCSGPTETATPAPESAQPAQEAVVAATEETVVPDTVPGDGEGMTLVSLKVPNMH